MKVLEYNYHKINTKYLIFYVKNVLVQSIKYLLNYNWFYNW